VPVPISALAVEFRDLLFLRLISRPLSPQFSSIYRRIQDSPYARYSFPLIEGTCELVWYGVLVPRNYGYDCLARNVDVWLGVGTHPALRRGSCKTHLSAST